MGTDLSGLWTARDGKSSSGHSQCKGPEAGSNQGKASVMGAEEGERWPGPGLKGSMEPESQPGSQFLSEQDSPLVTHLTSQPFTCSCG